MGGLALGEVADTDPKAFKIFNGKLYLGSSKHSFPPNPNMERTIKQAADTWGKLKK